MSIIYLDNAATTPVIAPVIEAMLPFYTKSFGNPSSVYSLGREARVAVESAREQVANLIGAEQSEIYFTSCGTEADNWAIFGAAYQGKATGKTHLITSKIEHPAVLHSMEKLEKDGFNVTYLEVDSEGLVSLEQLNEAINEKTALVSIMYANNEIGTVQSVSEIGAICRKKGVLFHTDAVQAAGALAIDVTAQNIDLLSISAHKFNGPKGIGVLFIKKGVSINKFIYGGAQEKGKRAGTENVAEIVGLATALKIATENIEVKTKSILQLRKYFIEKLLNIPKTRLNGHPLKRLPNNINVSFEGIEGESILLLLDMKGICASSGSACSSGSLEPSHVLLAIGLSHEIAHGSLRLTLSDTTSKEEIDFTVTALEEIVARLRDMSPVWNNIERK